MSETPEATETAQPALAKDRPAETTAVKNGAGRLRPASPAEGQHPLLGLTPDARRQLARHLVAGVESGGRSSGKGALGGLLGRLGLGKPALVPPERLVLAAGILVAVRRPVSSHLLCRLVGRAYPLAEVQAALSLLLEMRLVRHAAPASGVLMLTPAGMHLLHTLGVSAPTPRPRRNPVVPPHLAPLFAAVAVRAYHAAPAPVPEADPAPFTISEPPPPGPVLEPVSEPVSKPTPEPLPGVESLPEALPEPPSLEGAFLAPDRDPVPWEVEDAEPPPEPALPFHDRHPQAPEPDSPLEADVPTPIPIDRRSTYYAKRAKGDWLGLRNLVAAIQPAYMLGGVALVAVGFGVVFAWPRLFSPMSLPLTLTSAAMPNSQGTALQFNGKGALLSSYGGDLFTSIPERLDYKRAMAFQGFDMANDCALVKSDVRQASISPLGRFLWVETGTSIKGHRERCLIDLETRTVTHDLGSKVGVAMWPSMVGWASAQTLLMAPVAPPSRAAKWMAIDVVTLRTTAIAIPDHVAVLPLQTDSGPPLLAGFDELNDGAWRMTTYWLGEGGYKRVRDVMVALPAEAQGHPVRGAVSPDKRFLLVALAAQKRAVTGNLVAIALEDGHATPITPPVEALLNAPLFWDPEVRGNRYRFYFNAPGKDGTVPHDGLLEIGAL